MSVVIVDARHWQNQFDLRTGDKIDAVDSATTRMVRQVLADHPYPGDTNRDGNRWVTDTALDLIKGYGPQLVCLIYAQQYFAQRFTPLSEQQRRELIGEVFDEVGRLVKESGYTPLLVGTGNTVGLSGDMDLSALDGLAFTGRGSARYTGLHAPSERDLTYVAALPGVERVVARDEWVRMFPGTEYDDRRMPDYLMVNREGWIVRAAGTFMRQPLRVPACNPTIPVATSLGPVASITDIRALIEDRLERAPVALIILEGIGAQDFPLPFTHSANGVGWCCYEPGEDQCLTVTTGTHQIFAYPPGYRYYYEEGQQGDYPFSGYFREIPKHTLGADFQGKSIAVGNRSMFTHMVFGADISIECFSRNLYNQGCMAVLGNRVIS